MALCCGIPSSRREIDYLISLSLGLKFENRWLFRGDDIGDCGSGRAVLGMEKYNRRYVGEASFVFD